MNVVLNVVPFFLAARVIVDTPWKYGPEYTFHVQVNSTAIPAEGSNMSIQLNVVSKLACQPKGLQILSCRFRNSKATSYVTENFRPGSPAIPISRVSRQEAYEFSQEQFEIRFTEQGLDSLIVNENIQPRELDMIRAIVGQLNIGLSGEYDENFELMENFTQGECVTVLSVLRTVVNSALHANRGYVLETIFGLKDGHLLQIKKTRNLQKCTHKVPYFFGSAESSRRVSDVVSTVRSSQSYIVIASTEFISGMMNVITTSKVSKETVTILYENISVKLESILPAINNPPAVHDPETASIFIGTWLMDSSMEDDLPLEV